MSAALRPASAPVPPVTQELLDEKLKSAEISKTDLNALIFDYLVVEGFSDAAVEFARETGLAASVDQEQIQERMDIRLAVEDGRVEEAVRRVNELDPEILDTNAPLLFHLHLLRLIELIRAEELDKALDFATVELATRAAQHPEFLPDLERTMALLAFPHIAAYADDTGALASVAAGPADAAAAATKDDTYANPVFAPIIALMRRSQRSKVARELNAAILEAQGQGMETKLSGLVRLMAWGEERLDKAGVGLPEAERDRGRKWAEAVLRDEVA
ncbi:hypothetical protein Q5752_001165 [Cryptotrichosporon argae]